MSIWNPAKYAEFSDLRLRPALDLLNAIGDIPEGRILDLGCGAGAAAPMLSARFPHHQLVGVEKSEPMARKAQALDLYHAVEAGDLATYDFGDNNALLFTNAALNWLPDHATLFQRMMDALARGGWFAMQVPFQHDAPSHALIRDTAHKLSPDAFPDALADLHVQPALAYHEMLSPYGTPRVWQTEYMQSLPPVREGHPVRHFTQSTYMLPYLYHFEAEGRADDFIAAYDDALYAAYPLDGDERAWFPFKRLFVTVQKTRG